jgi:hypothetical protein
MRGGGCMARQLANPALRSVRQMQGLQVAEPCILLLSYDMYPPPLIWHVSSSSHMTCILLLSYNMYPPPLI